MGNDIAVSEFLKRGFAVLRTLNKRNSQSVSRQSLEGGPGGVNKVVWAEIPDWRLNVCSDADWF